MLISSALLFAQEKDSTSSQNNSTFYNNEWGINITGFANQFFSFNGEPADEGAFLFTYKYIGGKRALRLGVGLFLSHTNTEDGPNSAPLNTDGVDIDFRIGLERQFAIERRWLFTAGGDFLIGYKDLTSNSNSNFGTIKIKNEELSVGIGPVLGIHFRFSPRVSIGTEGTIYLNFFSTKSSTDFGGVGGGEETDKSEGVKFAMVTPLALYFAVRI